MGAKRPVYSWILLALFVWSACQGHTESASQTPAKPPGPALAPSLARARLTEATAAATKWKGDARLIQVAGRNVGADGKAVLWDYGFYSPAARTCLVVNVGRTTSTTESGGEGCESPELTGFMDSDRAATIARSNGITHPTATMVVSSGANPKAAAVWTVMDERGMKPGNVMLELDATTGNVLSRITQK